MLAEFNSLPIDKFLDWSKLGAFADDKQNLTEKLKFVSGRVEKIVGKGKNAGFQHQKKYDSKTEFAMGRVEKIVGKRGNGFQHFILFPQCLPKASFSRSLKVGIVW